MGQGKRIRVFAVWAAFFPSFAFGAGVSSTGAQFLKIPAGVRAAAMGETFTAIADDASAANWNTAGLSRLERFEVQFLHVSFFQSLNYEYLAAALPLRSGTVLGLSGALDFVPSFNSTNNPLAAVGEASDLAVALGLAQRFSETFSLGIGGKFLRSRLAGASATGFGLDSGLLFFTKNRKWSLGLSAQNIGQISSFDAGAVQEKLPATYRGGLAYHFQPDRPTRWTLSVEVEKSIDEPEIAWHAGTEFWLGVGDMGVAFRGGYKGTRLDDALGSQTGASFGAGIRFSSLQFDYAMVPFGTLGNTHRFSMTYRLPERRAAEEEAVPAEVQRPVAVEVQPELSDIKTGTLKAATFDLKPQARTDIEAWTLEITDPQGNVVRRFSGRGVPPKQIQWDGRDDRGNVVVGGLFANYNLRTVDRRGEKVTTSEPIFKIARLGVEQRGEISARELQEKPELLAGLLGSLQAAGGDLFRQPEIPKTLAPAGPMGVIRLPAIYFDAMSAKIKPIYHGYLRDVAALIRRYPQSRVFVEGHASAEGPESLNYKLSQQRADAVLRYLIEREKIAAESVVARGHGSLAPVDTRDTEQARAMNRRVEILLMTK